MQKIIFHYVDIKFYLPQRRRLKNYLESIFENEKTELIRLDYIFCTDNYLLKINKDFLDHDYYTDIITFDLSNSVSKVCSEIYISIERVKENSESMNLFFAEELLRVMIHGILHLCGFDDKTNYQKKVMTQKENYYLFVSRET